MVEPKFIDSVEINDSEGKKVTVVPGSKVDLLPPNIPRRTTDTCPLSLRQTHIRFLRSWLGQGPYSIDRIGKWPCGSVMFYFKLPAGDEGPCLYYLDFMAVTE